SRIEHDQPQELAVGRIVAEEASTASVTLARGLHRSPEVPKPVIFLTNADETFPLGETISRTTAAELRNVIVPIQSVYPNEFTPRDITASLKDTENHIWEGHTRDITLEERGGIATDEAPYLVILQGCYTLDRSDPFILIEKGAQAIVASSAAIYSAPGSAFA